MNRFSKRGEEEYNTFRKFFQFLVCNCVFGSYIKCLYNFKVEGKENIPKDSRFLVAANHISGKDPFILPFALNIPIAFMAKEELFEKFFSRTLMDFCGAFSVKRDKVAVSTIKTALSIKNTDWTLGIFPQGTRDASEKVEKITKGFATFAKVTKSDILPIAIIGSDKNPKWPFSEELVIKIGKLIPYSDNIDDMMSQWCSSISSLTGKNYKLAEA